ncbi:MAG TPA: methionine synthase I [Acidimicrobiaceae bacterium]|nr:methionine synthase I [Acidimicrobiaceae bacterium]
MRTSLADLLATGRPLLADGATGTNYFAAGLESGDPPEFWTVDHPDRVKALHQAFVEAGSDIILTNTFGCNPNRLKLHKAEARTYELAKGAAELAREVADACDRPVVVAGSVGPTGELFEPLGALTHEAAVASFREEIRGLKDGGADVAWIETMSAQEEFRAAAEAAIAEGMPYTITCSFDTAGRTMMGLMPGQLATMVADLPVAPLAIGANCGVGASDTLVSVLAMADPTAAGAAPAVVSKANCGVPQFVGTEIVYSGTPELMGTYAGLAIDAGARIIGGCCGTTPGHVASMRHAIDAHLAGERPSIDTIVAAIGPLTNAAPSEGGGERRSRRSRGE